MLVLYLWWWQAGEISLALAPCILDFAGVARWWHDYSVRVPCHWPSLRHWRGFWVCLCSFLCGSLVGDGSPSPWLHIWVVRLRPVLVDLGLLHCTSPAYHLSRVYAQCCWAFSDSGPCCSGGKGVSPSIKGSPIPVTSWSTRPLFYLWLVLMGTLLLTISVLILAYSLVPKMRWTGSICLSSRSSIRTLFKWEYLWGFLLSLDTLGYLLSTVPYGQPWWPVSRVKSPVTLLISLHDCANNNLNLTDFLSLWACLQSMYQCCQSLGTSCSSVM